MKRTLMIALTIASTAVAQRPPAIRQIGRLERTTTDSLASAPVALPMKNGTVLVHDAISRRVLLFDSTLAHPVVVADSTARTNNAYSRAAGALVRYHADSALFIDIGSLSMMVVDPTGKLGRVMAIPRPNDAQRLLGGFGAAVDAQGRLIYSVATGITGNLRLCCVGDARYLDQSPGAHPVPKPDTVLLIRIDLATRSTDTLGAVKIPRREQRVVTDDQGMVQSIQRVPEPLPLVDAWAVVSDGTLAVVRGRDYHVDWLGPDGRWTASPKIPFVWQRLDDAQKLALIDSGVKAEQQTIDRANGRAGTPPGGGARASGGRGGGRGEAGGNPTATDGATIPEFVVRTPIADVPDYVPSIGDRAAFPDAENNLWILTSARVDGRPVYDLVNRRGELIDRVQLPAFRTIAGFGPGVIYMAVKDAAGAVHLERARVR